MFMQYILSGADFIEQNMGMVLYVLGIVEYVKRFVTGYSWYRGEYMTAFGFLLGFLFAIPASGLVGVDPLLYIAHSISIGLVATGVYKVGDTLVQKAGTYIIAEEGE